MTTEELSKQVQDLAKQVSDLQKKQDLSYRQMLRLTNALQGTRLYYVANSNGGSTSIRLTFKDGILQDVASLSPSASPSISPSRSPSPSVSPS